MLFPLTSFVLSFVCIAILVGHKLFEMSKRETVFSKMRGKVDAVVLENISIMKNHAQVLEQGTIRKFFKIFFVSVAEAFVHINKSISEKWNHFFHSLKTGAVKKSDGEVSLFLKDISRDKKGGGGEKKM
ncbi:MAG: hypothetical protein PHV42_00405 [Candidatus Pacebacteria bacterium]|nr:hypothetical protein [Candidatus Paceibacterota bacterium]